MRCPSTLRAEGLGPRRGREGVSSWPRSVRRSAPAACAGAALLTLFAVVPAACSRHAVQSSAYETLHNISDTRNDLGDPREDPAPRPSYEVYRQQRDELLAPPTAPAPAVPPLPPEPAGEAPPK